MIDRDQLRIDLEAAIMAIPKPVTPEAVMAKAAEMLRQADPGAHREFDAWFKKHREAFMEIVNRHE